MSGQQPAAGLVYLDLNSFHLKSPRSLLPFQPNHMILDAHQHFWQYHPERHAWIGADMRAIQRDFMPPDLEPLMAATGVSGTVLVQVDQTPAENRFCLELASRFPWIRAVVGWVDLQAPDLADTLAHLGRHPQLKGFRHIAQAEPDPMFLVQPSIVAGIRTLGRTGFTYDLLVYPHQLEAAVGLVGLCPDQPFVLDHLAKPYIRKKDMAGWKKDLQRLSTYENVSVKLSGLVTEAHWDSWQPEDIFPYLEVALQLFGPKRLMWGSDWPVCGVAATYAQVLQLVLQFIHPLSAAEKEAIMGGNAAAFYNCLPLMD